MKSDQKIEGYWYADHCPQYPMPKVNVLTEQEAIEIYEKIREVENTCHDPRKGKPGRPRPEKYIVGYRGPTRSRITGEYMGSREYVTPEWRWPEDYAEHYVLNHRVKPTDEFLKYIGYEI